MENNNNKKMSKKEIKELILKITSDVLNIEGCTNVTSITDMENYISENETEE